MTINEKELTEKASKIKMLLMDVDGVLTDGKMYFIPGPDGKMVEFKAFNSLDGIGLRLLNQFGIKTGIITGRISPATLQRAKNLGMTHLYQGFVSKLEPMKIIAREEKIKADEIAYIGDDWTDIPAMKAAGLACAPANARQEVKDNADYISPSKGGEGAVRDTCELILYSKGLKEQIMKQVSEACWPPIIKKEIKVITGKE